MSRLLFACTELHSHGGIQRFNRNLVQSWIDLGADIDIVSLNDSPSKSGVYSQYANVRCYYADHNKSKWLLVLARLLVTSRYKRYVCGHINLAPAFVLLSYLLRMSVNGSVLILHGIEVWGRVAGAKRVAARAFSLVLGVSQYTLNSFMKQVDGFPNERAVLFPNTINIELDQRKRLSSRSRNQNEPLQLLSVSRLDSTEREKGIMDVLSALANLKDKISYHYVVVGDGDDRSNLETYASQAGISESVYFAGSITDEDLWCEYERADVFILPSKKEGFGIVFLEGMLFGHPVIGAAEKGAVDVIEDGVNGYLVEYGNIEQLSERIENLASDPSLRMRMGEAGHRMVVGDGKYSYSAFRERSQSYFL